MVNEPSLMSLGLFYSNPILVIQNIELSIHIILYLMAIELGFSV